MGVFKGTHARLLTLMVSITLIVILSYIAIMDDKTDEAKEKEIIQNSEVQVVLEKDLQKDYPASVREVVKFYCRTISCLYNEELSSEESEKLIDIECELFDKELLESNKYSELLKNQQQEIDNFKKAEEAIFNYEVDTNENVKTWYHNKLECASVKVCIKISGTEFKVINEKFVLRKDDAGKWKIVGWTHLEDETSK